MFEKQVTIQKSRISHDVFIYKIIIYEPTESRKRETSVRHFNHIHNDYEGTIATATKPHRELTKKAPWKKILLLSFEFMRIIKMKSMLIERKSIPNQLTIQFKNVLTFWLWMWMYAYSSDFRKLILFSNWEHCFQ